MWEQMVRYGWHSGLGTMGIGTIGMALFWIMLILVLFVAYRDVRSDTAIRKGRQGGSATDFLKTRNVRGDIERNELEEKHGEGRRGGR